MSNPDWISRRKTCRPDAFFGSDVDNFTLPFQLEKDRSRLYLQFLQIGGRDTQSIASYSSGRVFAAAGVESGKCRCVPASRSCQAARSIERIASACVQYSVQG